MATKRKPPALDRYNAAAQTESDGLARALELNKRSRPRDMAEALAMMDPFAEYERAHSALRPAIKAVGDGERRRKGRPAKPVNSNDPLLHALRASKAGRAALTGELTKKKIAAVVDWLYARDVDMAYHAVEKMLRRARAAQPE